MTDEMNTALFDGLTMMVDTLGARRKIDDRIVAAYGFCVEGDGILPEDVAAASRWFCKEGEGSFPAGPVFRKRCLEEVYLRDKRRQQAEFEARQEAEKDLFDDEYEGPCDWAEAKDILEGAFARMDKKQRTWPGEEKPKDMKREIARLREAR